MLPSLCSLKTVYIKILHVMLLLASSDKQICLIQFVFETKVGLLNPLIEMSAIIENVSISKQSVTDSGQSERKNAFT